MSDVCAVCGGVWWEDAEDGGRCINCGTPHPNMLDEDERDDDASSLERTLT